MSNQNKYTQLINELVIAGIMTFAIFVNLWIWVFPLISDWHFVETLYGGKHHGNTILTLLYSLLIVDLILFSDALVAKISKPFTYSALANKSILQWRRQREGVRANPLHVVTLLWLISILISIVAYLVSLYPVPPHNYLLAPFENSRLITINGILSSIAGAEATLVGIVIPILFVMVEQLFRSQSTHLSVFLYWSKLKTLVLSSLGLVASLFIQIAIPTGGNLLSFCFDVIWMLINVAGTAYLIILAMRFYSVDARYKYVEKYLGNVILKNEIKATIEFSLAFTHDTDTEIGGKKLAFNGALQKLKVRLGLNKNDLPSVKHVLHDLSMPVLEKMSSNTHEEFSSQLRQLVDAHVYAVLESGVKGNREINYATLGTDMAWFKRMQFAEWYSQYLPIFKDAIRKIDDDNRYYHSCLHQVGPRLYTLLADNVPAKVTESIIKNLTILFTDLSMHIRKQVIKTTNETVAGIEMYEPALPAYIDNQYDPDLKHFIYIWEEVRSDIGSTLSETDRKDIDRVKDLRTHLQQTAAMILFAATYQDRKGSLWICDTYLRWNDVFVGFENPSNWSSERNVSSNLTTLFSILKDPSALTPVNGRLLGQTFINYWFDTSYILCGMLVDYGLTRQAQLPIEVAGQILNQKMVDKASRLITPYGNLYNLNNLLASFVRISGSSEYRDLVTRDLNDEFRSYNRGERLFGRPYMSAGYNSPNRTFANLLMLSISKKLTRTTREIFSTRTEDIENYVLESGERYDIVLRALFSLQAEFANFNETNFSYLTTLVTGVPGNVSAYRKSKRISVELIKRFRKNLADRYTARLHATNIIDNDVTSFQHEISREILKDVKTLFPANLFTTAEITQGPVAGVNERIYTKTPKEVLLQSNPTLSEYPQYNAKFFAGLISGRIRYDTLFNALDNQERIEGFGINRIAAWHLMVNAINAIRSQNLTPIVFASNTFIAAFSPWVYDFNNSAVDRPFNFTRRNDQSFQELYKEGYNTHFYDTPVFLGQSDAIIVVAQENLQKLKVHADANGDVIELDFLMSDTDQSQLNLLTCWRSEAQIKPDPVHYIYNMVEEMEEEDADGWGEGVDEDDAEHDPNDILTQ